MTKPVSIGGNVYAGNYHIIISHPGELAGRGEDRRYPDVSRLQWDCFESGGFRAFRTQPVEAEWHQSMCTNCFGFGVTGVWSECQCQCEYIEGSCKKCNGLEIVGTACPVCEGTCYSGDEIEAFGGAVFDSGYIARLKTLGDLDAKVITRHEDSAGILLFRGHNVRGFLMATADARI